MSSEQERLKEYASSSGPHNKNPVQTGYHGQVPPDVEHFHRGRENNVVYNASGAPRNAATGRIITDQVDHRSTGDLTPESDELVQGQVRASVESTLGGSTSQDVNRGLGAPVQGETSAELHNSAQQPHRKRQHEGVYQYGSQAGPATK